MLADPRPHSASRLSTRWTGDDKPAILRGSMVSKYLRAFIDSVEWGPLDCLIIDLPPGTGDIQLTLAHSFPSPARTAERARTCSAGEAVNG